MTMPDGMGTSDVYNWTVFALSLVSLGLAVLYMSRAAFVYRTWRDERSAMQVVKAVGLTVIALGTLISAGGLITDMAVMAVAGMSIARGAFLVLILTLLLVHGERSQKGPHTA
jgi:vacuolar-type H+-ATPase subunit I/STV1